EEAGLALALARQELVDLLLRVHGSSAGLRPEILDEAQEHARADGDVVERHRLGGGVADALLAAHEEHADVGEIDHRHPVVAGAAPEPAPLEPPPPRRVPPPPP